MSIVEARQEEVGGMNVEGMDPKTALNQYCQRYCSRPVTKTDIVYTNTKFGSNQYQAIVKLNCMQGQEYAGEVSASPKEAEKSAADQALQAYKMVSLPAPTPGSKKKKPPGTAVDPETGELVELEDCLDNSALTDKVLLNATCMKIAKRALAKGETVYEATQVKSGKVPLGFCCSVRLLCLPEPWSERVFEGEACTNKQAASQSAAKVALEAIMADPELCELASSKPPVTSGGKGKGKGFKGKLLWGKGWSDLSGPDLPREMVTEVSVTGEVLEWKGYFGWLKPDEELDHPAAALRGGRVYVHQQDLEDQLQELQANARVRFQVYCDPSGLGATQVTLC